MHPHGVLIPEKFPLGVDRLDSQGRRAQRVHPAPGRFRRMGRYPVKADDLTHKTVGPVIGQRQGNTGRNVMSHRNVDVVKGSHPDQL